MIDNNDIVDRIMVEQWYSVCTATKPEFKTSFTGPMFVKVSLGNHFGALCRGTYLNRGRFGTKD